MRALNSAFAMLTLTPDGTILTANNLFLDLFGYGLDEVEGQHELMFMALRHGGDLTRIWDRLKHGEAVEKTLLCNTKAGSEIWLACNYIPLIGCDGEIEAVVRIGMDVSAQQSREADDRGQVTAINASQPVVHFSLDGIILDANPLFLSSMGYRLDEIVGQHHSMFVEPELSQSPEYKRFWQGLAEGRHASGEYCRVGKDGREVWLQASYNPIFDLAGRPLKVVKYATDITTERMRQADYQWQISAINRSHAVVTFDMHGVVLDANALFIEAMGYSADEIIGSHHRIFVEPAYAHGAEYAAFWRGLQRGRHHAGQYRRIAKDGSSVWLQATYNPIFDARDCLVKVVKYATIVTEERLQQADHQGQIAAIHQAQCVISFDLDGTVVDANDNFLDAVGYRYSQVRGQHHSMFVDAETAASAEYAAFWKMLSQGEHHAGEYKRIASDGREIWLQATYNPILDMNGQPFKVVKYATDVTLQKLQQADYQGQIEAVNKSQGVVELALDGTILHVNDKFLETLGYTIEEIRGRHHRMLVEPGSAEQQDYADFWSTLRSGKYHSGLYKRIGKDGRQLWIQASYNPILDLNGHPVRVMKFATDVTSNIEMAEAYADASRQAHHDAATSLPNRVKLASFMTAYLTLPAAQMTVFYLDLDRFKPVNDTFGHHVGDRVLGEIADRLRRQLRPDQIVARVGGDEFVIAAPDLPIEEVERFARRLIDIVQAPIRHEDGEIAVGISVGIAMAPTDGSAPDQLLRAADAALYQSKQNGRGTYSFFAVDMNDRMATERRMADEMRRALSLDQFFLEYQPRFHTRGRVIRSVEALVRWAHPERGRISPADFIPLSERNGLIVPMGAWILNAACRAAIDWGDIGVSVNVSPVQFRDSDLVATVAAALAASGLPAGRLELEITEGVLLDDGERALSILSDLKRLGVKLAMDDFGTGYSSLSYLRNFPFDVIKIDRGFIADMQAEGSSRSIVQAILALGKALGLSVTAEGVETNEQLAMLSMDQCDEVQGFLLARPLPAAKISELLIRLPELTFAKAS